MSRGERVTSRSPCDRRWLTTLKEAFDRYTNDRMARHRIIRKHAASAAHVIDAIVDHLVVAGYKAGKRVGTRVALEFDGSLLGETLAQRGHDLEVVAGAENVAFEFASALTLSLSEADVHALEAVVEGALASVPARVAPPALPNESVRVIEREILVARCKFCQQITPVDLDRCRNCGAAKFV